MPVGIITGLTWNHNKTTIWPNCSVLVIEELTGVKLGVTTSNDVGYFEIATPDQTTAYSVIADATGCHAGILSEVIGHSEGA